MIIFIGLKVNHVFNVCLGGNVWVGKLARTKSVVVGLAIYLRVET